jgi:hypothetical protein
MSESFEGGMTVIADSIYCYIGEQLPVMPNGKQPETVVYLSEHDTQGFLRGLGLSINESLESLVVSCAPAVTDKDLLVLQLESYKYAIPTTFYVHPSEVVLVFIALGEVCSFCLPETITPETDWFQEAYKAVSKRQIKYQIPVPERVYAHLLTSPELQITHMERDELDALFIPGTNYTLRQIGEKSGTGREQARSARESLLKAKQNKVPIEDGVFIGGELHFSTATSQEIAWKAYTAKPRGKAARHHQMRRQ